MSMLGLVLGFMCLGGAYYNAKIWWTMGDDKAGLWALGMLVMAVLNFGGLF